MCDDTSNMEQARKRPRPEAKLIRANLNSGSRSERENFPFLIDVLQMWPTTIQI